MKAYGWPDVVGILGVTTIVVAYLGLQLGRLDRRAISYSMANAVGAGLVLVSLWFNFNLSAFVVEVFWVLISFFGITRGIRRRLLTR